MKNFMKSGKERDDYSYLEYNKKLNHAKPGPCKAGIKNAVRKGKKPGCIKLPHRTRWKEKSGSGKVWFYIIALTAVSAIAIILAGRAPSMMMSKTRNTPTVAVKPSTWTSGLSSGSVV